MPKLWRLMPSKTNTKPNNSKAMQILRDLTGCTAAQAILHVNARKSFAADSANITKVAADLNDAGFRPIMINGEQKGSQLF